MDKGQSKWHRKGGLRYNMTAARKDTRRNIRNSLDRYFSIVLIVALWVAFFFGLHSSPITMRHTLDKYYKKYNLMDFKIISTLGITDRDLMDIRSSTMVDRVEGRYTTDQKLDYGETSYNIEIKSYNSDKKINRLKLISGRLPENSGEMVIEANKENKPVVPIGTRVTLYTKRRGDKVPNLKRKEFTIVGSVQTPENILSAISKKLYGNGSTPTFGYILEKDFAIPTYTEAVVQMRGTKDVDAYTPKYDKLSDDLEEHLQNIKKYAQSRREIEIIDMATSKLKKGEATYWKKKFEADSRFMRAEKKLDSADIMLNSYETILDSDNSYIRDDIRFFSNEKQKELSSLTNQVASLKDELSNIDEDLLTLNERYEENLENLDNLYDKKINVTEKRIELEKKREDVNAKLEKAKRKIDEIKTKPQQMPKCRWYILSRDNMLSYRDYGQSADRVKTIAGVFPIFFALVSILVCLTSITRMVDEQRTTIGLMKALGYTNREISRKYTYYSATSATIGSILGIIIGVTVFPVVVFYSYGMLYITPGVSIYANPLVGILCMAFAIFAAWLTAALVCNNELNEVPSSLMLPKAPPAGKKVLLERIPAIWSRMSFNRKITTRNIFRYKKRFFMTIFGIMGCTALLLAGFGLRDSLTQITGMQFAKVIKYDAKISLEDGLSNGELSNVKTLFEKTPKVKSFIFTREDAYRLPVTGIKDDKDIMIGVFDSKDRGIFHSYQNLIDYKTLEPLPLKRDGAILTEQYAQMLEVKPGQTIDIKDYDNNRYRVKVTGIAKNSLANYLYMDDDYYEKVFKKKFISNKALMKTDTHNLNQEEALRKALLKSDLVTGVEFKSYSLKLMRYSIDSIQSVFAVLIVSAALLAFVVLYNLTNININERIREIATIKVLGFYNREVGEYIFREIFILSLIGSFIGLFAGIGLHRLIINTVEMDNMKFGTIISLKSYLFSFMMTMLFTVIVSSFMYFKLKKVKMVESLKSVE